MKTTTPACTAPGSWSCGMMCAQTASTVRASSLVVDCRDPLPVGFLQGLIKSGELSIDENDHPRLHRTGILVLRNDVRTNGFHRARLFHTQETPRAFRPRATYCGSGQARDDKPPAIHPTDRVIGFTLVFNWMEPETPKRCGLIQEVFQFTGVQHAYAEIFEIRRR